jgi:hypothetical protein
MDTFTSCMKDHGYATKTVREKVELYDFKWSAFQEATHFFISLFLS